MKNLIKTLFVAIVAMSVTFAYAQNAPAKKEGAKKEKMAKKEKPAKKSGKMAKKGKKKAAHAAPAK